MQKATLKRGIATIIRTFIQYNINKLQYYTKNHRNLHQSILPLQERRPLDYQVRIIEKGNSMLIKTAILLCLLMAMFMGKPLLSKAQGKKEAPKGHVLVWLDADCPLSQKCAFSLKNMHKQYADSNIRFLAIFPENHKNRAQKFMQSCGLGFPFIIDHKDKLTKQFGATTTPEAVLLNPTQQIMYQGQIDNLLISTDSFRLQATEFYLKDAIGAFLRQEQITLEKTEPIGSLIE